MKVPERLKSWIQLIALGLAVFAGRASLADHYHVPSGSMEPTIRIGDRLFVNKLAYGLRFPASHLWITQEEPERGDVIVFDKPNEDIVMVKRLIGLPGDELSYDGTQLSINGVKVAQVPADRGAINEVLPGATHPLFADMQTGPSFSTRIPPGQYFMMGDHRNNSADSRVWGPVPRENLLGRAVGIIYSGRNGLEGMERLWIPLGRSASPDARLSR